jgi:hypothetical protein
MSKILKNKYFNGQEVFYIDYKNEVRSFIIEAIFHGSAHYTNPNTVFYSEGAFDSWNDWHEEEDIFSSKEEASKQVIEDEDEK